MAPSNSKKIRTNNEELPEHLIVTQILPRLPTKSLLRFKSVRKSWYASIRSPELSNSHTGPKGSALLFCNLKGPKAVFFAVTLDDGKQNINRLIELPAYIELSVSESVNGIFSIYPPNYVLSPNNPSHVSIFNPSTTEIVSVPPLLGGVIKKMVYYHFGFDTVKREYKIVGMCHSFFGTEFKKGEFEKDAPVECQIFTFGRGNCWRRVNPVIPVSYEPTTPGVCVNDAIHWLVKDKRVLLAFDLGKEVFRVIQLPTGIYENFDNEDDEDELNDDGEDSDDRDEPNYNEDGPHHEEEGKWPWLIQAGGFLAIIKYEYLGYMIKMFVLEDYQNEEWVVQSMECPTHCDLNIAVPYGSIHSGEFILSLNHGRGLPRILCFDMSQKIHWSIGLPEDAELRERGDSDFIFSKLISCYPGNIMSLKSAKWDQQLKD